MSKLIAALVAAVFALTTVPAFSQTPKSDEKDSSVRKDAREAKAKAKRAAKKTKNKARRAKDNARDDMKKDNK
ncbi:MAG TPA: hypothetical protein VJT77_07200 [Burkholderiales bacterium]|nr:hypothetical protein [Burkholderiales bacterium]